MPQTLLLHHDGNTPSKHLKQVIRAGATRSREAHPTLDGPRHGQAVMETKHWSPMPLNKFHTNPLWGLIIRARLPLAARTWLALRMHPQ